MTRLGDAIRKALQAERTMGSAAVASIVRPGEVTLEDRDERVLVAGNSMPMVGETMPWVLAESGLLVASHNLPQVMPGPVSVASVTIPITLYAELLYGDDLDIGHYCYAASWDPSEGGVQVGPAAEWIETRAAGDPVSAPFAHIVPGSAGAWPNGLWAIKQTVYKDDGTSGDAETELGGYNAFEVTPSGGHTVYFTHSTTLPRPNGTGSRVYAARGHWESSLFVADEPWRMISEQPGTGATVYISDPAFGAEPVGGLAERRVAIRVIYPSEQALVTLAKAGISRMILYRSLAQEAETEDPPVIGSIGEISVPLPSPIYDLFHFIDDTGPGVGEPPDLPWGEL